MEKLTEKHICSNCHQPTTGPIIMIDGSWEDEDGVSIDYTDYLCSPACMQAYAAKHNKPLTLFK